MLRGGRGMLEDGRLEVDRRLKLGWLLIRHWMEGKEQG